MPETLLTPSGIKLFGRVVTDLLLVGSAREKATKAGATAAKLNEQMPAPNYSTLGSNAFLKQQLANETARLARIYGFSFEGHYYALAKPVVFLVHTDGTEVLFRETESVGGGGIAGGRTTVDTSGVVARDWEFAADDPKLKDLRMWEYDKGDFSLRIDIDTGSFDEILLETALRSATPLSSGADLRTSGADLRSSGADLRTSGADLRVSGADLRRR